MKATLTSIWDGKNDSESENFIKLYEIYQNVSKMVLNLQERSPIGYLVLKDKIVIADEPKPKSDKELYSEFTPVLLGHNINQIVEFPSFNTALDEFFTKVEATAENSKIAAMVCLFLFHNIL